MDCPFIVTFSEFLFNPTEPSKSVRKLPVKVSLNPNEKVILSLCVAIERIIVFRHLAVEFLDIFVFSGSVIFAPKTDAFSSVSSP